MGFASTILRLSVVSFASTLCETASAPLNITSSAAVASIADFVDAAPVMLSCTVSALSEDGTPRQVSCNGTVLKVAETELLPEGSREWWQDLICAFVCVLGAALAAGLTLGLTSFDEFGLKVLCNLDVEDVCSEADAKTRSEAQQRLLQDQRYAEKILPLISGNVIVSKSRSCMNPSSGHALLVTLLLANASANEALPLFLDRLIPSWLAIIVSVTVVLIFGEIVPSAIFTGPSQLRLAAAFTPVVQCVRTAFFPVVWPISLLLDRCLGDEESEHGRGEMKATAKTLLSAGLEPDEVNMIHGVLDMHQKTAEDIAKPLGDAKMLAHDEVVTNELINKVLGWGHSRVFVYKRDPADPEQRSDIIGVLLVKKLLGVSLAEGCRVDSVHQALKDPVVLDAGENLLSVLNKFQDGMCHLAIVRDPSKASGEQHGEGSLPADQSGSKTTMFCSLEDVIETMLREDIFDEEDVELGRAPVPPVVLMRASSVVSGLGLYPSCSPSLVRRMSRGMNGSMSRIPNVV